MHSSACGLIDIFSIYPITKVFEPINNIKFKETTAGPTTVTPASTKVST